MGALSQAVGPPLLNIPFSFGRMPHRRKPGTSPAVHLPPLASGNKGETAGSSVSRTSEIDEPLHFSALILQSLFLVGFASFAFLTHVSIILTGMAWTEAEHLAFLNGLKAFGRVSNLHSVQ